MKCFNCESKEEILDLGDDVYVCRKCWDRHIPEIV